MTSLDRSLCWFDCVSPFPTAYTKVQIFFRHLEVLGNICVRPPFATDKNDFFWAGGLLFLEMLTDFLAFFLRSPGTWSHYGTPLPSTRLTMLKREEGRGTSLLFQLRGQRKKIKLQESIRITYWKLDREIKITYNKISGDLAE